MVKPTGIEGEETFLNNYFHDMLRMFQLELDKPQSVLFVIGFSFQDSHIAKMFKRALQNTELLTFVFAYTDEKVDEIKKNLELGQTPNNLKILSPRIVEIKIKGVIENNEFKITSKYTPMIGNEVSLTSDDELSKIYGVNENDKTIIVGQTIIEGFPAKIPINKFFASHIGIFGNTGSGKSNTLHKMYLLFTG